MKINREFWRQVKKEMAAFPGEWFLCHCSETFKKAWHSEDDNVIRKIFRDWLEKRYQIGSEAQIVDSDSEKSVLFDTDTVFEIIGWSEYNTLAASYSRKLPIPPSRRMILDSFVADMCR